LYLRRCTTNVYIEYSLLAYVVRRWSYVSNVPNRAGFQAAAAARILALPTDAFHVSYFCLAVDFCRLEAGKKLQQLLPWCISPNRGYYQHTPAKR